MYYYFFQYFPSQIYKFQWRYAYIVGVYSIYVITTIPIQHLLSRLILRTSPILLNIGFSILSFSVNVGLFQEIDYNDTRCRLLIEVELVID